MERSLKIKTFQLEIELESESEYHYVTDNFFSIFKENFNKRFQLKSKGINYKKNIRFDKIVLDIGQIDLMNLNKSIDDIIDQLVSNLNLKIREGRFENISSPEETMQYFAKKGRLPWGSDNLNKVVEDQFEDPSDFFITELRKTLTSNIIYFSRILDNLNTQNQKRLMNDLLENEYDFFIGILKFFEVLHANLSIGQYQKSFDINSIQFELFRHLLTFKSKSQVFSIVFDFYLTKYSLDKEFTFYKIKSILNQKRLYFHDFINQYFEGTFKKLKKKSELFFDRSDHSLFKLQEYIFSGVNLIEGKLEITLLKNIFREQLKSNTDAFIALIVSPSFLKEKLHVFRLVQLIEISYAKLLVKKMNPDLKAKKIIHLIEVLPSSIFIQRMHQKIKHKTFSKVEQLIYSILFEYDLRAIPLKKITSFFYKKLAKKFGLNRGDFVIQLYFSISKKRFPKAFQESLDKEYLRTIRKKIKKNESLKFNIKHLFDSNDSSMFKLLSDEAIKISLLKNIEEDLISKKISPFQKAVITNLYPFLALLYNQPSLKKKYSNPKFLLNLFIDSIIKEKSENLTIVINKILVKFENESNISFEKLKNLLINTIQNKVDKVKIHFQILSALISFTKVTDEEVKKRLEPQLDDLIFEVSDYKIQKLLKKSELNYLQSRIVIFLTEQFVSFKGDEIFKKSFPKPIDFVNFLVTNIKIQGPINQISSIIYDLVSKISKKTNTSINKWTLPINKSKSKRINLYELDREWLSLFASKKVTDEEVKKRLEPQLDDLIFEVSDYKIQKLLKKSELNYLQSRIVIFLTEQFVSFKGDEIFKKSFPKPIDFVNFLVTNIKIQGPINQISSIIHDLVSKISKKTNTSINKWTLPINKSKSKRINLSELDREWLSLFTSKKVTDEEVKKSLEPQLGDLIFEVSDYKIQKLLEKSQLNFLQSRIVIFLTEQFVSFKGDEIFKKSFPKPIDFVNFLVTNIKIQGPINQISSIIYDLVSKISKKTNTSINKWTLPINKSKSKRINLSELDIEWLALFTPDTEFPTTTIEFDKLQYLNFFKRVFLNYIFFILKNFTNNVLFKNAFDSKDSLLEFLFSKINESNSNDFDILIEDLLRDLVQLTKMDRSKLEFKMVQNIKKRNRRVQLDYRFLFLFDTKILDGKNNETSAVINLNKELTLFEKRTAQYFHELLNLSIKTLPNKKSFFKVNFWIEDLKKFTKSRNSENFSITVVQFLLYFIQKNKINTVVSLSGILIFFSNKSSLSAIDGLIIRNLFDAMIKDPKGLETIKIIRLVDSFGSLILNLISKNLASKYQLEKLILFPDFLNNLKDYQLIKIFELLYNNKKNKFYDLINSFLNLIPNENKATLRNKLLIYSFRVLFDDHKINQEDFLLKLIEYVSTYDLSSVSKSTLKKEIKNLVDIKIKSNDTDLQKLIFKIQKEGYFDDQKNIIEEDELLNFEILLTLKNQKINTVIKKPLKNVPFTLSDFDKIISNKENLIKFLSLYRFDNEILFSFTQISFSNKNKLKVENLVRKTNKKILDIENYFKIINSEQKISKLSPQKFSFVLRIFIFKQLPYLNKIRKIKEEQLAFDFASFLSKERYLDSPKMIFWNKYISDQRSIRRIVEGFSLFNDSNIYLGIDQKSINEIYFKDFVFYFFKTSKIPNWAISKMLDFDEAYSYVNDRIKARDSRYIKKLFSEERIANRLGTLFSKESKEIKLQLLNLLVNTSSSQSIVDIFEITLKLFENESQTDKVYNEQFVFNLIIDKALWNISSSTIVLEIIIHGIKKIIGLSQNQFIEKFNKFSQTQVIHSDQNFKEIFLKSELESLLHYYIEKGTLPFSLRKLSDKTLIQIRDFIEKDLNILTNYFNLFGISQNKIINLFSLISEKKWIYLAQKQYFSHDTSLLIFFTSLINVIAQISSSEKVNFEIYSKLYEFILTKSRNSIKLVSFLSYLKKSQFSIFDELYNILITKFISEEIKKNSIVGVLIVQKDSLIKIPDLDKNLLKNEFLELIDYYIIFGSLEAKSQHLSQNDLKNILSKIIRKDPLLLRKKLFQWGSKKESISRFLALMPDDNKSVSLDLIHPDFTLFLDQLIKILQKYLRLDLYKIANFQSEEDLIIFLLKSWSSNSLYIDHPNQVLQQLIEELILNTTYSKVSFFGTLLSLLQDLEDQEDLAYIMDLQRNYESLRTLDKEKKISSPNTIEIDEKENLYIENAGLIILWPFIYQLFDKLNLLFKKDFKNDDSLQKAIILTQYLCTGSDKIEENELILNKLICGAQLSQYVNLDLTLEPFEKDICNSLLNGVIKNWEKIGNTSIDGLRKTFLMREGVLRKTEQDYTLFIKKMPFDVLLDTLPWNISMIQNVFMKFRIIVDWN